MAGISTAALPARCSLLEAIPVRGAPHRRLRFQPIPRRPGPIGAISSLRYDAFEAHPLARGEEFNRIREGAGKLDMLGVGRRDQARQALLALHERLSASSAE